MSVRHQKSFWSKPRLCRVQRDKKQKQNLQSLVVCQSPKHLDPDDTIVKKKNRKNSVCSFFSPFYLFYHPSTCLSDAEHTCAPLDPLQDCGEPQISISFAQQKLLKVILWAHLIQRDLWSCYGRRQNLKTEKSLVFFVCVFSSLSLFHPPPRWPSRPPFMSGSPYPKKKKFCLISW